MTLKYRYIGKGTTDSNGIAHMTEDADGQTVTGYTGTGKGLTDIIASTDDSTKISDSSIQSEPYSIWDYIKYDKGTINDHKDIWTVPRGKLERTDEYSSVAIGTDAQYRIRIPFVKGQVIEFDYNTIDLGTNGKLYNWQIYFVNSSYQTVFGDSTYMFTKTPQLNTWYHVKIEVTDVISIYPEYSETPTVDSSKDTSTIQYFEFYNPNGIQEVGFKNLKVYPI